jgi:integrase
VALAGKAYVAFADAFEDDPASPDIWKGVIALNGAAERGDLANPLRIATSPRDKVLASINRRVGPIVDAVLRKEGLVVDDESRAALLLETLRALTDAAKKLQRNAQGDYSPDTASARFPAWNPPSQPDATASVTITSLLNSWKVEAKGRNLAAATFDDYNSRIGMFIRWLGLDDARRVTADDIVRYKDHRLALVSVKTVKDSDLSALKSIFGHGMTNKKLPTNPAQGITVKAAKRIKVREPYFTEDEIKAILVCAKTYTPASPRELPTTVAAKRWLPWLCAYTGARVGEMGQLRKEDIFHQDGASVLTSPPPAGPVKANDARHAPIHAHLIEEGFLDFVKAAKPGYLFLNASDQEGALRVLDATKNRVRELIRTVVADPRVAPNHGWRHTFKTIALEADIDSQVADAICGHAPRQTVGDKYRHPSLRVKAAAIRRFPRYRLSD